MNTRIGLVKSLAYTVLGYLFLFVAVLTWHVLAQQPNDVASLTLIIGLGLRVALVNLLMVGGALVSLHWPKRLAAVICGAAVIAGILLGLFNWPAYLLWQLMVELAVAMGLQVMAFAGAHLAGYRLLRSKQSAEGQTAVCVGPAQRVSVRDLFLLVTSFALLFATLRFLQPVNIPGWLYAPLFVCGGAIALMAVTVAWAMLSEANWMLRTAVLLAIVPAAALIFDALSKIYLLLYNPWFYAAVAFVTVLMMSLPLVLLRANGFRIVRKTIAVETPVP